MSTVVHPRRNSLVCLSLLHMAMPLVALPHYEPTRIYKDQYMPRNFITGEGKNGLVQLLAPEDNGIDYFRRPYKKFGSPVTNQIHLDKEPNFMKKVEDDIFSLNLKNDIGRGRRALSGVLPFHSLALQLAVATLQPEYSKYNKHFEDYDDGIVKLDRKPKGFLRFGR